MLSKTVSGDLSLTLNLPYFVYLLVKSYGMEREEMEQFADKIVGKLDKRIEDKIDEKLDGPNKKNGNKNGTLTRIFVGVAIVVIGSFGGSFLTTHVGQRIDREKIRNNEACINRIREDTQQSFSDIKSSLNQLEDDQLEQWKYILEFSETRSADNKQLKKNLDKEGRP